MTALLMFVVLETATGAAATAPAGPLAPIAIGLAVFLAHVVLIPIDGCSINPTRSFGPMVVSSIRIAGLSTGDGVTAIGGTTTPAPPSPGDVYKNWWIFWVGPLVGAALATGLYKAFEKLEPKEETYE